MKRHIKIFLAHYPFLFRIVQYLHNNVIVFFKALSGFVTFYICILFRRPYFGFHFYAQQLWQSRAQAMRSLLEQELQKHDKHPYLILEIGSWAGESAVLWGKVLKENKKKGRIYCMDIWAPFHGEPGVMQKACKNNKILKLFLHNIESSSCGDIISILRGSSDEFASLLSEGVFDWVYIDGTHYYEQVKKDLLNYAKLVRGGVLYAGMI